MFVVDAAIGEVFVGVRVAVLVCDVFRTRSRFGIGVAVARVLAFHSGRSDLVIVAFTECPSSDWAVRRPAGVACVRRLAGRAPPWGLSPTDISRVPNLAFAELSRPYEVGAIPLRVPLPEPCLGLTIGFCSVTLSAPQYEKLILLLRSESSESPPSSSSSSGRGTMRGCTPECTCCRDFTTLI